MKKTWIALLLVVCMLIGLPFSVRAADNLQARLNDGEAVVLDGDVDLSGQDLNVPAGASLDLNGHTLRVANLMATGEVTDDGTGLLCATEQAILYQHNPCLPLYDASKGGYRLFDYEVKYRGLKADGDTVKFGAYLTVADAALELLTEEQEGLEMNLRATVKGNGRSQTVNCVFSADLLAQYAQGVLDGTADTMVLTATGFSDIPEDAHVTVVPVLSSALGTISRGLSGRYPYVAESVNPDYDGRTLRVLAIGNSFSRDAMTYLYDVAKAEGVQQIVLGNLYLGAGSLSMHVDNMTNNSPAYIYYKNTNGTWVANQNATLEDGITDEPWDIVTLQQVSSSSFKADTYNGDIDTLIAYVRSLCANTDVRFGWHMTWAYQDGSASLNGTSFANHGAMFDGIAQTVQEKIVHHKDFTFFIPAGTAVETVRSSYYGDNLNTDGLHLNSTGYVAAAYTWYASLTGREPADMTAEIGKLALPDDDYNVFREATANAVNNPFDAVVSTYPTLPDLDLTHYEPLNYGTQSGYWYSNHATKYDKIHLAADAFGRTYLATQRFTPDSLPVGSVIELDSGYKLRAEAWEDDGAASARGVEITPLRMKVTKEFWDNYAYRAFNLTTVAGGVELTRDDESHLRIYLPKEADGGKTLRILSIGNSFSRDAQTVLWDIAKAEGYDTIILGNLYTGGCLLSTHAKNAKSEAEVYQYYYKYIDGQRTARANTTFHYGVTDEDWDIVTLQQGSTQSGLADTYNEDIDTVLNAVRAVLPDAKIYWHMTWAYYANYSSTAFTDNYGKSQTTMYNGIINAVQTKIAPRADFAGIIPSGTAIQNARSSYLGDTFNSDGLHLNAVGRYLAGYTWFTTLTGQTPTLAYKHANLYFNDEQYALLKQSMLDAIANPYAVTASTYTTPTIDVDSLMELDYNYEGGYYNSTSNAIINDPNSTTGKNFLATERFTIDTLPYGSLIVLDAGWTTRLEAWEGEGKASKRGDNFTNACHVVNYDFWNGYAYRAFNLTKGANISSALADASNHLHIYVPRLSSAAYEELDFEYKLGYWNCVNSSKFTASSGSTSTTANKYIGIPTRFTQETLPVGTIIEVDKGWSARFEYWTTESGKESARGIQITGRYTVTEDDWTGNLYRSLHIEKEPTAVSLYDDPEGAISHLHIYIPKTVISAANEWKFDYAVGYWYSIGATNYNTLITPTATNTFPNKYIAVTPRLTIDTLPIGSVIVIGEGYEARASYWITDAAQTSQGPTLSAGIHYVTEDFWDGYLYRSLHLSKIGVSDISDDVEGHIANLKIYRPTA